MACLTRSGPRTRQPRKNEKQIKNKSIEKKSAAKKHIRTSSKKRKHLDEVMDLFYKGEDKLDKKENNKKEICVIQI